MSDLTGESRGGGTVMFADCDVLRGCGLGYCVTIKKFGSCVTINKIDVGGGRWVSWSVYGLIRLLNSFNNDVDCDVYNSIELIGLIEFYNRTRPLCHDVCVWCY